MAFLARVLDLPVDIPAAMGMSDAPEIVRVREPVVRPAARSAKARGPRRARGPVFEAA
jgi:hypothetical protein